MKLSLIFTSIVVLITSVHSQSESYPVTYSSIYDDLEQPVTILACGGSLKAKNYTTLGSLPNPNFIGGGFPVTGYDSGCFTCWQLINIDGSKTTNLLVVDAASPGFNVGSKLYGALGGEGNLYVSAVEIDPSICQIPKVCKLP